MYEEEGAIMYVCKKHLVGRLPKDFQLMMVLNCRRLGWCSFRENHWGQSQQGPKGHTIQEHLRSQKLSKNNFRFLRYSPWSPRKLLIERHSDVKYRRIKREESGADTGSEKIRVTQLSQGIQGDYESWGI